MQDPANITVPPIIMWQHYCPLNPSVLAVIGGYEKFLVFFLKCKSVSNRIWEYFCMATEFSEIIY